MIIWKTEIPPAQSHHHILLPGKQVTWEHITYLYVARISNIDWHQFLECFYFFSRVGRVWIPQQKSQRLAFDNLLPHQLQRACQRASQGLLPSRFPGSVGYRTALMFQNNHTHNYVLRLFKMLKVWNKGETRQSVSRIRPLRRLHIPSCPGLATGLDCDDPSLQNHKAQVTSLSSLKGD